MHKKNPKRNRKFFYCLTESAERRPDNASSINWLEHLRNSRSDWLVPRPALAAYLTDKYSSDLSKIFMPWCRVVVPWWAPLCATSVPDVMHALVCQKCPNGVCGILAVLTPVQTDAVFCYDKQLRQSCRFSRLSKITESFAASRSD